MNEQNGSHAESTDERMRRILLAVRSVAIVGASDNPERAAFGVMRFLQDRGYRCIPVNPRLADQKLLGETVFASLGDIPVAVDMADLFVNSRLAGAVSDEALALGIPYIWMQLGVIDAEAAARAEAAGTEVIMNHCPAREWHRLGLPDQVGG